MRNRYEFDDILRDVLGNDHVYFQPPTSIKMSFPAIRYSVNDYDTMNANNKHYIIETSYEVILISKDPDNPVVKKLLDLPMSSFDSFYTKDNMNYWVFTIYY